MKFRFETILRINKNREDLVKRELGVINTHLQKQQDHLQLMEKTSEQSTDDLNSRLRVGIDINFMRLYDDFFNGIKYQESRQKKIISEVEARLEGTRKKLVEAMRKRRIMEILKEREFAAFKKEQEKRENMFLDETAANMGRRES
ncbi:MAG: flagellar export protein FliJ [Nitrospinae bacterium CG11_big_fil_rev_8_21_14_0_20_56_8]|nr:MAG: flagellar export protein FliJ [Nitrospinae bacterium CG11_big_fil_rev_8_21_14_0_20_56_8]